MSTVSDSVVIGEAGSSCGLARIRADVACDGPLIWRVVYVTGVGVHKRETGRVEPVCFGHGHYEEAWTHAAQMVRVAELSLISPMKQAVEASSEWYRELVGEHGPEMWPVPPGHIVTPGSDLPTGSMVFPRLTGEQELREPWLSPLSGNTITGESVATAEATVARQLAYQRTRFGPSFDVNKPLTMEDCTHGGGNCPVHPHTNALHNFDPQCGRRDLHEPHEFTRVIVDASPLFVGGAILGANIGQQVAGDPESTKMCDGGWSPIQRIKIRQDRRRTEDAARPQLVEGRAVRSRVESGPGAPYTVIAGVTPDFRVGWVLTDMSDRGLITGMPGGPLSGLRR